MRLRDLLEASQLNEAITLNDINKIIGKINNSTSGMLVAEKPEFLANGKKIEFQLDITEEINAAFEDEGMDFEGPEARKAVKAMKNEFVSSILVMNDVKELEDKVDEIISDYEKLWRRVGP